MRTHKSISAAIAAFLVTVVAGSASAQTATSTVTDTDAPISRIEAIEIDALGHLANLSAWDRAAKLFRRAAELRPEGDPTATENLIYAARLSFYEGDTRQAVRDFEAAGQRALAMGDVLVAANAFADAAWVAHNRGSGERALGLLSRARLLANSPLIAESERLHLRSRWDETGQQ